MMFRLGRIGRLSWRRLFIFCSAFTLFWVLVFSLTPITSPLPPYTGPHAVGVLDVETEVERRVINDAVLKETGQKAFELQTLAITLYYPSTLPTTPHKTPLARPWLPQPISLIGTGYARLAGIRFAPLQSLFTFGLWALGSSTMIPGIVDAPLLSSSNPADYSKPIVIEEAEDTSVLGKVIGKGGVEEEVLELRGAQAKGAGALPCVVFTHGMAGMSQSYSHYLGSIASHGYVVAAVEHRDGSGPGTVVHYPDEKERFVWHLKLDDLVKTEPAMTARDVQIAQLAFREAEIHETMKLFARLNAGSGSTLVNLKPDSPSSSLQGFTNRLNLSAISVVGHSYGATGALQALKPRPNDELQINGGIALDPGKGSGPLNKDIEVPVLAFHSGEWTEKQTEFYGQGWHFDVVKKTIESVKKGWFMTLTGTAHPSCTDAPLIVPWIMRMVTGTTLDPVIALREYIDVSVDFLDGLRNGAMKGVLKSGVTSSQGPLGDAEKRGTVKGKSGADWEVHVVPTD